MIIASIFTFILYVLSITLLRSYFDTSYITLQFIVKVVLISTASWLPLHLAKVIINKMDPSEERKIKKQKHEK